MHGNIDAHSPAGAIRARVLVHGIPLPLWGRPSDGRLFAAAVVGRAWTLEVVSLLGSRIEAVVGVDGRSVHRDEPAGAGRGHVIEAYGRYEFKGWRLDQGDSAPFLFADPAASVAAMTTGDPSGVGVIGIIVYGEHRPAPTWIDSGPTTDMAPVASASPGGEVLKGVLRMTRGVGTGIGRRTRDPVGQTEFERDGRRRDRLVIGYDTEEALRELGIIRDVRPDPDPFPGLPRGTGYERFTG
jgi:hypothetical protein